MAPFPEKSISYSRSPSASTYAIRIALPAGVVGGILLIAYFLIIRLMGLHMQTELRWINFLLVIPLVIYAINKYVTTAHAKSYLEALVVSLGTCITAFFVHGIFMVTYLYSDTVFMNYLYQEALPELQMTPLSVFLMIMLEGIVGGVVISFVTLQFFKDRIRKAA